MNRIKKQDLMRRALIIVTCLLVIWPFLLCSYPVFAIVVLPEDPITFSQDPNRETNRKPTARVSSNGQGYLCIWEEQTKETGNDIFGKIVDKSGTLQGKIITISKFTGNQKEPDIDSDGDSYLAVWSDDRDPNSIYFDIYGALISADGKILKEIPIETGAGNLRLPRIKWNGQMQYYFVAWEDWKDHTTANPKVSIYGKRVDPNGQVLDQEPEEITVDYAYNKVGNRACFDLASMEDPNTASWLIMWSGSFYDLSLISGLDILVKLFYEDPNGDLVSTPLRYLISMPSDQYYPSVEGMNNRFLVAWENWADTKGTDKDILGFMLDPDGNIVSRLIYICSAPNYQTLPEVSTNGQGFFVLWLDRRDSETSKVVEHLYGARISPDGLILSDDPNTANGTRISTNSNQMPRSFSVASSGSGDDRYFCFWSASEGTVWTLTGRIYDPPPSPVLYWTGLPGYEEDGVDPNTAIGGSPFTFKVEYVSPGVINEPPEKAQIWIDLDDNGSPGEGEVFDMLEEEDPNTDYTTGRVYSYQNPGILYDGDGILAYTFLFMDKYNVAVGEPTKYNTFNVELEGYKPLLDWTNDPNEPGFTEDGARPDGAQWDTNTPFQFRVIYKDEDGDPPQKMQLWIDKNGDSRFDPNHERLDMEADGASYQQGQIYTKTVRLMLGLNTTSVVFYKFESDDGKNKAVGDPRWPGSYLTLNPMGETSACLNTHNQFLPSIAGTGSGYQLFWQDPREFELDANDVPVIDHIWMELLSQTGQVKDGPGEPGQKRIDKSPKGATKPMARFNPETGKTLLIWEDLRNSSIIEQTGNENNIFKPESIYEGLDIYGIFMNADGEPIIDPNDPNSGGEFIIGGSTSDKNMLNADMAVGGNGQYLVVWESESRIEYANELTEIWAKLVTEEDFGRGDRIWIQITVPGRESPGEGHQLMPRVAWNGQYYLVVWQDVTDVDIATGYHESRVYGIRIDPNGVKYPTPPEDGFKFFNDTENPLQKNLSDPNVNQLFPDIASDGENFLIVWQDSRALGTEGGYDIYGMRVNVNGLAVQYLDKPYLEIPICTAEGNQIRPRVYWDPQAHQYIITWIEISYPIYPVNMLLPRIMTYPRTGTLKAVRMDPNGRLIDSPDDVEDKYEGTSLVGVAGTQDRSDMVCDPDLGCRLVWEDLRSNSSYDLYTASFQSTLDWVYDPNLQSTGVQPPVGAAGGSFTFRVEYRDRSNILPDVSQVWIDLNSNGTFEENEKFDMEAVDPNASVSQGLIYTYYAEEIEFSPEYDPNTKFENLAYRFYFENSKGKAQGPGSRLDVVMLIGAPQLEWTGEPGFTDDGVDPNEAESGTQFNFSVKYTDESGLLPEVKQIWIDQDDNGEYGPFEKSIMKEDDSSDTDTSDGKIYTFSTKLFHQGDGIINYRFFFHNGEVAAGGKPASDHSLSVSKTSKDELWEIYRKDNGLPGNTVTSIEIDQNNVVWAGIGYIYGFPVDPNAIGLTRFDGVVWQTFKGTEYLPNNFVQSIEISSKDYLWVATYLGISHFDGDVWSIDTQIDPNSDHVNIIASDDDGNIWADVLTVDPNTLQDPNAFNDPNSFKDPNFEIYGGGLARYDSGEWTFYKRKILGADFITAMDIDTNGILWAGIIDVVTDPNDRIKEDYKGIVLFDPNAEQVVTRFNSSEGDYPGGDYINTIYIDASGDVWVGSQSLREDPNEISRYGIFKGMGLSHYSSEQKTWTQYIDGENGVNLGSNLVMAIDRRGDDLWLGHTPESETLMGGATYHNLTTGTWQVLNSNDSPSGQSFNKINELAIDAERTVWFATVDGVVRYIPPDTILTFTDDAGFVNGVSPNPGKSGEEFEFRVQYSDKGNTPPDKAQVWLDLDTNNSYEDDEKFDMLPLDPNDQNYTDGVVYFYTITITGFDYEPATLPYKYYFEKDSSAVPGTPANDHDLNIEPLVVLTFTDDTGFVNGVSPESGKSGTKFEFRVQYSDDENIEPDKAQVWIDLDANDNYEDDEKFDMRKVDPNDNDYMDGVVYSYTRTINLSDGGSISYMFYFEKSGRSVTGTPTEEHEFVVEPETPIELMWQTFHAGKFVSSLALDKDNKLWVGFRLKRDSQTGQVTDSSSGGMARLDGSEWSYFKQNLDVLSLQITPTDNHLWAWTSAGLFEYDGITWTPYEDPDPNINFLGMAADNRGRVWVVKSQQYLSSSAYYSDDTSPYYDDANAIKFDPNSIKFSSKLIRYESGQDPFSDSSVTTQGNFIYSLTTDPNGQVWIGISDISKDPNGLPKEEYKGIVIFNPDTGDDRLLKDVYPGYPGWKAVFRLDKDDDGDIWVLSIDPLSILDPNSFRLGLSHFNYEDRIWSHYTNGQGDVQFLNLYITDIDRKGNDLWLGHYSYGDSPGGATKHVLESSKWEYFNNENVNQDFMNITALVVDQRGIVWFGSSNGLFRYNSEGVMKILLPYNGLFDPNEESGCFIGRTGENGKINSRIIILFSMIMCVFLFLIGFFCRKKNFQIKNISDDKNVR